MSEAILEFRKKSVPVKIEKAEAIVAATGSPSNPNYRSPNPTPSNPTLAEITVAVNELKTARQNSVNAGGGTNLTAIVAAKEIILDGLMSKFLAFIQMASGGDDEKIRSAGLGVKSQASATQQLTAVQGMVALVGKNGDDGQIDLDWDTLEGATAYSVRLREAAPAVSRVAVGTPAPETPAASGAWRTAGETGTVTKSEMIVSNLVSGTRYEFQACGINSKGKGGWSDPAFRVAP